MLNLSLPTCFSSNTSQEPSTFTKEKKKEKEISLHSTPKFPVNNTSKKDNSTDHKQIKNVMLTSSMTLFTEV
jgi:hypothetical protein